METTMPHHLFYKHGMSLNLDHTFRRTLCFLYMRVSRLAMRRQIRIRMLPLRKAGRLILYGWGVYSEVAAATRSGQSDTEEIGDSSIAALGRRPPSNLHISA